MFGFLDLDGNTGMGQAGQMAPDILLGADQLVKSGLEREKLQQDMLRESKQDTINEMMMPMKIGVEGLSAMQKINVMTPEPTIEDIDKAKDELLADNPDFMALPRERIESYIFERANEIAANRMPERDPFNPGEFLSFAQKEGISDLQAQVLKNQAAAEGRMAVENIRQQGQTQRTLDQIRGRLDETGIKVESAESIADAKERARVAEEARKRAEQQRKDRQTRGQKLYDEAVKRFGAIGGRRSNQLTAAQRNSLVAAHEAMAEHPEFQAQFRQRTPALQELLRQEAPGIQGVQGQIHQQPLMRRPRNLSQMREQAPPQPTARDQAAIEWLKKNPKDPNAEGVRQTLERKGLL